MEAKYFTITDVEAGIQVTGKRSSNYHCYLEIYDEQGKLMPKHNYGDVYYGKWTKCENVITKWRKDMKRLKLEPLSSNPELIT